ncbi:hypothetical protein GCM10007108_04250 [Thermogymnomonas acidicola]|uniref:Uncharacterized protein n=1 Tax=Thermogymnomonas acidicola TaxID=399579 RepID=A0AA37BQB3_9ARCH|nr:hypothetical protein GCM10007108_04250 [Thermogymnomonas acidicola]
MPHWHPRDRYSRVIHLAPTLATVLWGQSTGIGSVQIVCCGQGMEAIIYPFLQTLSA